MKVTVSEVEVHPSSRITRLPGTMSVSATSLAVQFMEGKLDASFTQPPETGWAATGEAARRPASPSIRVSAPLYAPPTKLPGRYGPAPLGLQTLTNSTMAICYPSIVANGVNGILRI